MTFADHVRDSHFRPGLYVHYKGGRYRALMIAKTHNHNGDLDVIYTSLTTGEMVTRPYKRDSRNEDSWIDLVTWSDGSQRPRFCFDDTAPVNSQ